MSMHNPHTLSPSTMIPIAERDDLAGMDFSDEPSHSSRLVVRAQLPYNAEPCSKELVKHHHTPDELMYCRNHGPVPRLDKSKFTVRIDGFVENQVEYTLEDIRSSFDKVEVVAALECAGNRRKHMVEKTKKSVKGVLWDQGTICNAKWGGARLRDVLLRAGLKLNDQEPNGISCNGHGRAASAFEGWHVCFASHVTLCQDDACYGSSIPLQRVLDEEGDVLLAYEVSGEPLSPDHGYPFRIVVPGYCGARWVKWVDQITVTNMESPNFYQQRDYKILPPNVANYEQADDESWWAKLPPIQENPLNSAVTFAEVSTADTRVILTTRGYAVSGASAQVSKVDVSINDGDSWLPAEITYQEGKFSWTLWEAIVDLGGIPNESMANGNGSEAVKHGIRHGRVLSRASNERGEMQLLEMPWNMRGVAFTAVGEAEF